MSTHTPGPWTHLPRARDGHVDSIAKDISVFVQVGCPHCPRCGQLYAVHNGDGSCVQDEPYVPTKTLNAYPGIEVVAKRYRGELYAATYSNRTQAERKAARLGPGWSVYHWGRPFYVGREVKS